MVAKKTTKKKSIGFGDKKLTMRDISPKKEIDIKPNTITHIDLEENNDGFVVINDVEVKLEDIGYYITEEGVQRFFQFIKEKAFYQQLGPLVVINKFKDIIGYK